MGPSKTLRTDCNYKRNYRIVFITDTKWYGIVLYTWMLGFEPLQALRQMEQLSRRSFGILMSHEFSPIISSIKNKRCKQAKIHPRKCPVVENNQLISAKLFGSTVY